MGRHTKPKVTICIAPETKELLDELAAESGRPVSSIAALIVERWVREEGERVLGELWERSKPVREAREAYARLVGALGRIGNNLNQIALRLNRGDHLDDRVAEVLERIERAMAEIARIWRPAEVLRQVREEEDDYADQG